MRRRHNARPPWRRPRRGRRASDGAVARALALGFAGGLGLAGALGAFPAWAQWAIEAGPRPTIADNATQASGAVYSAFVCVTTESPAKYFFAIGQEDPFAFERARLVVTARGLNLGVLQLQAAPSQSGTVSLMTADATEEWVIRNMLHALDIGMTLSFEPEPGQDAAVARFALAYRLTPAGDPRAFRHIMGPCGARW